MRLVTAILCALTLFAAVPVRADTAPALVPYTGKPAHIFFHSLIIYPQRAFRHDRQTQGYEDYMVTRDMFTKIIADLYKNNYVLVDIRSIYGKDEHGHTIKNNLMLPPGKKPLIISIDDLSYYSYMHGRGFANKLVLDSSGNVATEVINLKGEKEVTRDGDVVPLLDDFVKAHPDFSVGGAKGLIALTGFEGILGYRTQITAPQRDAEVAAAKTVIDRLKATGWSFASHSYSHNRSYALSTISLDSVKLDAHRWHVEVEPIVGPTDIFVGPFGQIFHEHDPRRLYLESRGFRMFCGVGMDQYLHYYSDHVVMDRADIDGYRIHHNTKALEPFFDARALIAPTPTDTAH